MILKNTFFNETQKQLANREIFEAKNGNVAL